ncbi:MAG: hypothetical protein ACE5OZ_11400 [Candidatus Heimdallarchaeota archaeon]
MTEERAGPEQIFDAIKFVLTNAGDIAVLIMNGVLYLCICFTIIMIVLTATAATISWGDPMRWLPKLALSVFILLFLSGVFILYNIPITYPTIG